MKVKNAIEKYSYYLDKVNRDAYKHIYMLSNPTLSKNPYTKTRFLHNIISGKKEKNNIIKSFFLFYIRNITLFALLLPVFVYSRVFYNRSKRKKKIGREIVLIDSFYGESELGSGILKKDKYFKQLYDYFDQEGISYYLAPKFYGFKSPLKYISFYSIFNRDEADSFVDISIIQWQDLLKVIQFIVVYPFSVLSLINAVRNRQEIDKTYKQDLIYSLTGTDFYPYFRYIFGRRLSKMFVGKRVKVISWCENQVNDKNFYKGLRVYSKEVKIYGAQFLFKFPTYACLYVPEQDKKLGISPDILLVTGKYYIPADSVYEYRSGPAFRYSKIRDTEYKIETNQKIIVMLPYVQKDAFNIINIMQRSTVFMEKEIHFKVHPIFKDMKPNYLSEMKGKKWELIDEISEQAKYSFVISSGSGSSLEFSCLGLSAVIISSNSEFTTNPMPETGKRENWDIVKDANDLEKVYKNLLNFRVNQRPIFEKNVIFYRDSFLSEINDETIKFNFDFK